MWKLLYKLFNWDFVLVKDNYKWKIRKVEWIHNEAFCNPKLGRNIIDKSDTMEYFGRIKWKPLTPNMFKYKTELKRELIDKIT